MIYKPSVSERIFDISNYIFLALLSLLCLYPFWYAIIIAFNDDVDSAMGGIYLWPRVFTLQNMQVVLQDGSIIHGFWISVGRTLLGSTLSIFFTAMISWGVSRRELIGRKFVITFLFITMLFNGGIIPYYLLLHKLHMINNFLVYVIPGLFSTWNLIIMQSSYREIPEEVIESAKIEGANDMWIFLKIGLPLVKPMMAALFLFTAVGHWNDWFSGAFYVSKDLLRPLATQIQRMNAQSQAGTNMASIATMSNYNRISDVAGGSTPKSIHMATLVLATVPVLVLYPFLQRYFVKGVMIGSIKG